MDRGSRVSPWRTRITFNPLGSQILSQTDDTNPLVVSSLDSPVTSLEDFTIVLGPENIEGFPGTSDLGKESAHSAGDLDQEDPLEKGMATHPSILAWKIPWTGEPGGQQSTGSQSQIWLSDWHFHFVSENVSTVS